MSFLSTILAFLTSEALTIWSKVSGSVMTIINEIPDDEITILHGAMAQFSADLHGGQKTWGEAAADVWTYVANQEGQELSKVANLVLQAFIAKFEILARMWSFISAIVGGILSWIGDLASRWLQRREDRAAGARDQSAAETASTARAEALEAQAEADSPRTDAGIDDRLKKGTF